DRGPGRANVAARFVRGEESPGEDRREPVRRDEREDVDGEALGSESRAHRAREDRAGGVRGAPCEREDRVRAGALGWRERRELERVDRPARAEHEEVADRERGDGDRQGHGERGDDGERQRERLDEDDRRDRSEPRGDKSTMKQGPDASRDREHTQQQTERRERHAVPVGEEEIEEWEEAPRSKSEENFDDQK